MKHPQLLLALALLFAACLNAPTPKIAAPPTPSVPVIDHFPVELNHDHGNAALHKATLGFQSVAFLEAGKAPVPDQLIVNIVIAKDTLAASLGNPAGGSLAPPMSLLIANVKDPTHPVVQSVTPFPGGGVESVAISDDARFAFLGTEFSGAVGIWSVSLSDPAKPAILGFTPIPFEGPHTLRFGVVGGKPIVFSAVAHVATAASAATGKQDPLPVGPHLRVDLFEFNAAQAQTPMRLLSSYVAPDQEGVPNGPAIVHDTFLQVHPITKQALLYVSHWDRGLRILDVTNPSAPKEIGKFVQLAPAKILAVHTVIPNDGLIDGRHYTVVAPICEYDPTEQCYMRILDTSDPTAPIQVGTWQLPDQVHGVMYTPQLFDIHGGVLVVPYMHAGLWSIDINSTAKAARPVTTGYHFITETPHAVGSRGAYSPWSNAVVKKDGYYFVADIYTGLHVVKLAATS
jgi:hypothetical protein